MSKKKPIAEMTPDEWCFVRRLIKVNPQGILGVHLPMIVTKSFGIQPRQTVTLRVRSYGKAIVLTVVMKTGPVGGVEDELTKILAEVESQDE